MKSEVYSWRVSPELKTGQGREARRRKISVSAALDLAAREWLMSNGAANEGDDEQRCLHQAASRCLGALNGGDTYRSENARKAIRQRLRQRHGR